MLYLQRRRKIVKIGVVRPTARAPRSRPTYENGYWFILLWGSRGRSPWKLSVFQQSIGLNHAILAPLCKISAKCWVGGETIFLPPSPNIGGRHPPRSPGSYAPVLALTNRAFCAYNLIVTINQTVVKWLYSISLIEDKLNGLMFQ